MSLYSGSVHELHIVQDHEITGETRMRGHGSDSLRILIPKTSLSGSKPVAYLMTGGQLKDHLGTVLNGIFEDRPSGLHESTCLCKASMQCRRHCRNKAFKSQEPSKVNGFPILSMISLVQANVKYGRTCIKYRVHFIIQLSGFVLTAELLLWYPEPRRQQHQYRL